MGTYLLTAPDGRKFRVTGDTPEGALQALQTMMGEQPQPEGQGFGNNVAQAAGDGLFFGFGDEISARLNAVTGYDAASGSYGNWGTTYGEQLDAVRGQEKQFKADHPVIATGAEVAGGLIGAAVPVGAAMGGATLGAQAMRGAATGAAMGGLYGFGEGEGGAASRATQVLPAALLGGAVGAAAPAVGALAGKAVKGVRGALADSRTAREIAAQAGVSKKAGGLLSDIIGMDDPARMQAALQRNGAMLADAGPTTQGALDAVIQAPGEGARTALGRIDARAADAGGKLQAALDDVLGIPEGVVTAQKGIRQSTAADRAAKYGAAFDQEIQWNSPAGAKLRGLLETTPDDVLRQADGLRRMDARPAPIPEAAYPEYAPTVTQQPGTVVAAQDAAEKMDVDAFFTAYGQATKPGMKRPLTNKIKKLGGIDPDSPAAAELYHLGVTPKTTPGLFRRGGLRDLDNIPTSDVADTLRTTGADDTGNYIDRDAMFRALRDELDGIASRDAADVVNPRQMAEMERMLPDYEARRAGLAGPDLPPDPGPVSDIIPMKTVRDIDQIKRALDDVRRKETDITGVTTGFGQSAGTRARELREALAEAAPGYREALDAGADTIGRVEGVKFGAKLLRPATTREEVAAMLKGMDAGQKAAVKQGVRSQIDDALANVRAVASDPNIDARQAAKALADLSSPSAKAKLRMLLDEAWPTLDRQIEDASAALGLRARVAANSRTYSRQQFGDLLDDSITPGSIAGGDFIGITAPVKQAWQTATRSTPAAVKKARAAVKNELADVMTRPQADKLLQMIEGARSTYALPASAGKASEKAATAALLTYGAQSSPELARKLRLLMQQ